MLKAGSGTAVQCADILLQHQTPCYAGIFCTSPALFMAYVEIKGGVRASTVIPSQELIGHQFIIPLTFINENRNLTEMSWQLLFNSVLFNSWNSLGCWGKWGLLVLVLFCLAFSWINLFFSCAICSCHWGLCTPVFSQRHPSFPWDMQPLLWGPRFCCCWSMCFGPAFLFPLPGRQSAVPQGNVNWIKYLWPLVWGAAVQMCSMSRCCRGPRRLNVWSWRNHTLWKRICVLFSSLILCL